MNDQTITENPITHGSIARGLLAYFFPIFIGSMFQQLYNTVDAIIVGKFVGTEALAAVGGSSGQIAGIVFSFLVGTSSGATVTVAQHYGAGDYAGVHRDIHTGIALSLIGSLFFSVIAYIFCPALFRLMKTPEGVMADSIGYIRILFIGLTVSFLYNIGSGILRALGDSKRPLYYLMVCSGVNIVLDLFFVICTPLGIRGAAIATVIAQAVSAVLVLRRIMLLDPRYALKIRMIRIYPEVMRTQLKIGLPGGFQSSLYGIANMIITTSINTLGISTVAAHTAFSKLDGVFWQINGSFGTATVTYIGQNYGAGKIDRVKKSTAFALIAEGIAAVLTSVVLLIFGKHLLRIFTDSPEVISLGQRILRTLVPYYVTYIGTEILSSTLRGMGDVTVPTVLTLSGICILRAFWMFVIVPKRLTLEMVFCIFPISWAVTSVLFVIYFLAVWKKHRNRIAPQV